MTQLCRKSNRCAFAGMILLHALVAASLLISVSVATKLPTAKAVESLHITLAEAVAAATPITSTPVPEEEVMPEEEVVPETPAVPPAPKPEPVQENVNLKPKEKNKPKEQTKTQPKAQAQAKPAQQEQTEAAPQSNIDPTSASAAQSLSVAREQKSMQNAVSALLARIEREKRYPNSARRLGLEGNILIRVEIDKQGNILNFRLKTDEAHPILQKSAQQAMERVYKKWKPVPVLQAVVVEVPIRFELH